MLAAVIFPHALCTGRFDTLCSKQVWHVHQVLHEVKVQDSAKVNNGDVRAGPSSASSANTSRGGAGVASIRNANLLHRRDNKGKMDDIAVVVQRVRQPVIAPKVFIKTAHIPTRAREHLLRVDADL